MEQAEKDRLLAEARAHLEGMRSRIGSRVEALNRALEQESEAYYAIEGETAFEDRLVAHAVGANTTRLRDQLGVLKESPYFARCDLGFADEGMRPYYFAKQSASELGIYSWTSPIAALRFEDPGEVGYETPDGQIRRGRLERRDQYMIARGHLNFMTTEREGKERELIYQEHFTRKNGFMLPEVVAQMEKAQDQVIRADHRGPFMISGPAGSGKTTLALHRVAYLRQAPETAEVYPAERILVLVQDHNTEDYFSHLLPELGIRDVVITTFAQWALERLELKQYFARVRPGSSELERDRYEFAKLRALREGALPMVEVKALKYPDRILTPLYEPYLDAGQRGLLRQELAEAALDRFDLTILMLLRERAEGRLTRIMEETTFLRGGKTRTKRTPVPLDYALVLVDEFQNYLPEQLRLLRGTVNAQRSMLYVGDLAQQTQLGTLRDWNEIDEVLAPERAIRLQKVYRNTRQILEYIRRLGYEVEVPVGVGEGPEVAEVEAGDVVEAIQYIVGLTRPEGSLLGIIAKDPETLETYKEYFADDERVRCMTMREAQGVEFDVVCLVGIDERTFRVDEDDEALAVAQQRIYRDLLYVALTRAMSELHVITGGGACLDQVMR